MKNTNYTKKQADNCKITLGTCGSLRTIEPNMYYKYDNKFLPAVCYLIGLQQTDENAVSLWDDGLEDELFERMEALNEASELTELVEVVDLQEQMNKCRVHQSYVGTVATSITVDNEDFVFVSYHTGTEFHEYVLQKLNDALKNPLTGPKYALVYENTGTSIRFYGVDSAEEKFLPSALGNLAKNAKIYKGSILREFVSGDTHPEDTLNAYISTNFEECTYIGFWEVTRLLEQVEDNLVNQLSAELLRFAQQVRDKIVSVRVFDDYTRDLYKMCNADEMALLEVIKKLQLSNAGVSFMLLDD